MKKLAICHQKGGVAKSTITQGLALELPGLVAVYDADEQGSTAQWVQRRDEDTPVPVVGPIHKLGDLAGVAEQKGCDWLIADTPPDHKDEVNIRTAMEVADFVILPTKMSRFDLEILPKTIQIANSLGKPWMIVITMGQRSNLLDATKGNLAAMAERMGGGTLCPTVLMNRVAHAEASYHNSTAAEAEPGGLAAYEMRQIATEVQKLVGA